MSTASNVTATIAETGSKGHSWIRPSIDLFLRYEKSAACCAAHSMAEIYASLTGMSGKDRARADEAVLFLGSVRERLTVVTLSANEYSRAIETAAANGVIHYPLLAYCALKAKAETMRKLAIAVSLAGKIL